MKVRIIGQDSEAVCAKLIENTQAALDAMTYYDVEIEVVEDEEVLKNFTPLQLPVLVVNGKRLCEGRVPSAVEIAKMLPSEDSGGCHCDCSSCKGCSGGCKG